MLAAVASRGPIAGSSFFSCCLRNLTSQGVNVGDWKKVGEELSAPMLGRQG